MGQFSQKVFNRFIIEQWVIGFFEKPITLKSGRQSYWYVNWRTVAEDVFLLDRLSEFVLAFTRDLVQNGTLPKEPECLYGVPEGATKLALLCQFKWAKQSHSFGPGSHVLAMGRGKPKEHGVPKDKYFVGSPRGRTVVLEDTTTTGGSLLTCIDSLLEADIPVVAAFGLTNRMERRDDGRTVARAIAEKRSISGSIPYFHLSNALELLPEAAQILKPPAQVLREIEKEFAEFGEGGLQF